MTTRLQAPPIRADARSARWHTVVRAPVTAVATIWVTTALMSVLAPDMITGSNHEHLPVAALTAWLWAMVASTYVLMTARGGQVAVGLVAGVSVTWLSALFAVIGAPAMVTGTDPTTIPIAVFVAPVVAAFTTGYLALYHAARRPSEVSTR